MAEVLDQLKLHPWTAILAGLAFAASLLCFGRKREERTFLLPGIAGLACLAVSIGLVSSARNTLEFFHAMALMGSGGEGVLAAGLAETRGALLLGLVPALLTLAVGLLATWRPEPGALDGTGEGKEPKTATGVLFLAAALLSAAVAGLGIYNIWFADAIPKSLAAPAGSVAEVSARISRHLILLSLLSYAAVAASAALSVVTPILALTVAPARERANWGRVLLLGLFVLILAGTVVVWRQYAAFHHAALIGDLY